MDDDDDFLFQLAAAEADAIQNSTKRRRDDHHESSILHPPKIPAAAADEGAYTAALKGSKSMTWQQQKQTTITTTSFQSRVVKPTGPDNVFGNQGSDGGDACFKCGQSGHWARDCVVAASAGGSDPEIPEKSCSCGLGTCLVLTANTEKNRGRKFYRCSVRQENGGCGFFEWCDSSTGANTTSGGTQSYAPTSSFPDLPCPCGAGSCLVLTAKTEKNMGQQFYRCPANQENSCRFFKWCTDQTVAAGPALSSYNSRASSDTFETSSKSYGATGGSSCFKCGKEGHWANDCAAPSNGDSGGRLTSPAVAGGGGGGNCYKCGLAGHWARDCAAPPIGDSGGRPASSGGGGTCYKCNQAGHWAKDCTSSQSTSARQKW